ncbi:hypothetical protein GYMLUDRAFT_237063 [Collybiopsis luxurians FD-317 M1]|nr:hypothetical protein GYMLUDRAFT_237063 [Collybiopsis luxurians FD-317 M1]
MRTRIKNDHFDDLITYSPRRFLKAYAAKGEHVISSLRDGHLLDDNGWVPLRDRQGKDENTAFAFLGEAPAVNSDRGRVPAITSSNRPTGNSDDRLDKKHQLSVSVAEIMNSGPRATAVDSDVGRVSAVKSSSKRKAGNSNNMPTKKPKFSHSDPPPAAAGRQSTLSNAPTVSLDGSQAPANSKKPKRRKQRRKGKPLRRNRNFVLAFSYQRFPLSPDTVFVPMASFTTVSYRCALSL